MSNYRLAISSLFFAADDLAAREIAMRKLQTTTLPGKEAQEIKLQEIYDYQQPRNIPLDLANAQTDNKLTLDPRFSQMASKPQTPKVGVGVVLKSPNKRILLVLRKGSHGAGLWSLPGGHMELGEDFYTACNREIKEELGITIDAVKPVGFSNDIFWEEGLHYVTLFFEAFCDWDKKPQNMEPNKAEQILWFSTQEALELPNLFPPLKKFLEGV